jgi:DMSO/TMAO reductase YedYZ molybdopterin-dependent catalytic subunit
VGLECAGGYDEGIDMPTALHPQTIMALRQSGAIPPIEYGYPFKIHRQPPGFWTDRGYDWFSGT